MSAARCVESCIAVMRMRVERLRDEAARAESEREARAIREMAGIIEQAMWGVEDKAEYYIAYYGRGEE